MNNQKGFIKFIYIIALFLLGVLIWGYFQATTGNFTQKSIALDSDITDTLVSSGFENSDIVSQSRKEQRRGAALWIEYFKEIKSGKAVNFEAVEAKLRAIAQKNNCSFRLLKADNKASVELSSGKKLFSNLIFDISSPPTLSAASKAKIAIVIDDLGYTNDLQPFLDAGIPLTFAILPHERYSKIIADELAKKGMPYILHLPLEPERYPKVNPGKAALLLNMSDQEIEKKFLSDLASVPGVKGVSNHMGSAFSENQAKMKVLLKLINEKRLFYFDSYTSSSTKAGPAAREVGIPFAVNSLFVDLKDDSAAMEKQFGIAMKIAKKHGQCAVIGHIQKKYLPGVLKSIKKTYKENGVEFVYLTNLVKSEKK